MDEYIEREAAVTALAQYFGFTSVRASIAAEKILAPVPAADVVGVRHGKWVWDENGMDWGLGAWKCSECHLKPETWWETYKGNPYRYAGSSYCNNCGAKMK